MASVTYSANAGQTAFAIPFDYISDSHLTVEINEVAIASVDWSLTSAAELELDPSYILAEGDTVSILRQTPDTLLVTFQSPASLRPRELTLSYKQLLFLLEELRLASGQGLPLSLTGTSWFANNLPIKSVGAPVDDGDAVTKIFLEGQLQQAGVLPDFDNDDIGLGLRVRGGGGGVALQLSPINGEVVTFEVPQDTDPSNPPGWQFGHVIHKGGSGISHTFENEDERVPLAFVRETGTPEAGAVALAANTFDLVIPRGRWRIRAFGSVRNLNTGTTANTNGAAIALTDSTGDVIYSRNPHITLGPAGGADASSPPGQATFPFGMSGSIQLEWTGTFLATTSVNVRASCATSASDVVIDYPLQLIVEEIPF